MGPGVRRTITDPGALNERVERDRVVPFAPGVQAGRNAGTYAGGMEEDDLQAPSLHKIQL